MLVITAGAGWGASVFAIPASFVSDKAGDSATLVSGSVLDSDPTAGPVTWIGSLGDWKIRVCMALESAGATVPPFALNRPNVFADAGGAARDWLSDYEELVPGRDTGRHRIWGDRQQGHRDSGGSEDLVSDGGKTLVLLGMGLMALEVFGRWTRSRGSAIRFRNPRSLPRA